MVESNSKIALMMFKRFSLTFFFITFILIMILSAGYNTVSIDVWGWHKFMLGATVVSIMVALVFGFNVWYLVGTLDGEDSFVTSLTRFLVVTIFSVFLVSLVFVLGLFEFLVVPR